MSDTAAAWTQETLDHLFEPFFTTKGVGKGTGLGLATVYGIVKQNDGFIDVYSEPGEGTTFRIYLPRLRRGRGTQPADAVGGGRRAGHGETILLVEDEPAILNLATAMLERLGYRCWPPTRRARPSAWRESTPDAIDLLLTDVVMPEMNGRDLARTARGAAPGPQVPVHVGLHADVIAHHGVLDEGVHFIQKPFSMQDLAAKVREALGG